MTTGTEPAVATTASSPIEAPGGVEIQKINAADGKQSGISEPIAAPQAPSAPEPRKLSVKEYLTRKGGTDAKLSLDRINGKEDGTRDPVTGKFVKQPKAKPAKTVPAAKPNAPTAAKPAPAEPEPVTEPTLPPPVNKIKVGDREMTEEEVQAHIAKLESAQKPAEPATPPAAEAPKPPAAPEPAAPAQQTPEEIKAREDAFIAEHATHFTPSQEQFDDMLATGNPKLFGEMIAKGLMEARKFLADAVNPHLERLQNEMEPVMSQQQQIREYQAERDFLAQEAHKDIATAPDASKSLREAAAQLHEEYDAYQAFKSQGQNIPSFLAKAATYEGGGWAPALAARTRQIIASRAPVAPPAPVAVVPPPAPKPVPRPAPPGGQPIGAGGANGPVSAQAGVIARISKLRY